MLTRFDQIPDEVRRRIESGERVMLIVLDAFGLDFLERHHDHPLVRRLSIVPLQSQFPSTTTAHMTTLHYGLRVEDHGLYEWTILNPVTREMVCPLRSDDAHRLTPGPTFDESLGAQSVVSHPSWICGSSYTSVATAGSATQSFEELSDGVRSLARSFAHDEIRYGLLYWDRIDAVGHAKGPRSDEFDNEIRHALDAVVAGIRDARGITILITADHGQIEVRPDHIDYLDEVWPELPGLLSVRVPAGSSRDVFLHPREDCLDTVLDGLAERLADRADVRHASDLFGPMGLPLKERVGQVVVLPTAGRQAWFRSTPANEQWFRGQHGGLAPSETRIYLAELEN